MKTTTGGYDGQKEGDGLDVSDVEFTLDHDTQGFSVSFCCTLRRNGAASGLLYVADEEEYKWLRERITGTFKRDG